VTVFFIGDVSQDEYYATDRWPGVADKGFVTPGAVYTGGSVANAASVHRALGNPVEFVTLLNDSAISARLLAALQAQGISTRHCLTDPALPDSRNLIFFVGGEHVVLTLDLGPFRMELPDSLMQALCGPGFLYTTLFRARRLQSRGRSGPALFDLFRSAGRRLVFDLDVIGFAPGDEGYLAGAEALVLNQIGFRNAFGDAAIESIGGWMARHGVRLVIRTLAAEGAEAFDGQEVVRVPGYRVPVVDVTGGGDTFGGALLHGLARDWPLDRTLAFAVAAASRSVTVEGPQGGVAAEDEVRAFMAEWRAPA